MENQKVDIYQIVTDKIIALLETGTIPWLKPWNESGLPKNLLTQKPYRGINILLLNTLGYAQNYFLTFDQVKAVGGSVKKNERSQIVVFWKWIDVKNPDTTPPDEKKQQKPVLRYYHVFNVDQCTNIPEHLMPTIIKRNDPIAECEGIVGHMPNKPTIKHESNEAYYHPIYDYVNVPRIETFIDSEQYYGTLFHELIHSTGHKNRLNRKELTEPTKFGTDQYSQEELIAEIGACNLKSHAGIVTDDLKNSAGYIQGWLARLHFDKRCIVYASAQAQKATDYILNIAEDTTEVTEHAIIETEAQSV
jgi:antirestriction protein ArdC